MIEKYKESLVAPLDNDELHIFNITNSLEKSIKEILEIINNRAYGIYLVGGMRGSGKTSTINLCSAKYWRSDLITITIDCNRMIGIESFIYFFIEELYKKIEGLKLPVEIYNEINDIRKKIRNNVLNKQVNENDMLKKESNKIDQNSEERQTYKQSIFSNSLELLKRIVYKESHSVIEETRNKMNIIEEIQEKNDEFILINRMSEVLIKISKKRKENEKYEDYNIVLIIDEVDKQNKKFIEDLLDYYKNLFLNSHITTFFIVDLLNYLEINQGNELENKLLSYFTKSIYIPTINDDDLKDYLYREFEVNNYSEVMIVNYLTGGVLRKINTYNYLEEYGNDDLFLKAYIYHLVLNKSELQSNKLYIKDLYKVFLKEVLEELFYKGCIYLSYIKEYIINKEEKYFYKYDFHKVIINGLIQTCNDSDYLQYIILPESEIKYFLRIKKEEEYKLLHEFNGKKIEYNFDTYQFKKINNYFYKEKPKYVKISTNQPDDVNYIIRLIKTLKKSVENIYIIKKVVEFFGSEQYSYSAILEVNRTIGRVMYTIENFSFSYEAVWAIDVLNEFMKDNGIEQIYIETDDETIEGNIEYIRDMLRKNIEGGKY